MREKGNFWRVEKNEQHEEITRQEGIREEKSLR